MKNIIKTISLLSIIAVIPGAMAATTTSPRISASNKTASRLPSIAGHLIGITTTGTTTTSTTTSSTAAYYGDSE